MKHNKKSVEFNPLWKYTETDLSKHFYASNSHTNDFTSSLAAFMSKDLLEQFTKPSEPTETKAKTVTVNKTSAYISKLFSCSKYGINVNTWLKFSTRMLFIRDVNYSKLAGTNI